MNFCHTLQRVLAKRRLSKLCYLTEGKDLTSSSDVETLLPTSSIVYLCRVGQFQKEKL